MSLVSKRMVGLQSWLVPPTSLPEELARAHEVKNFVSTVLAVASLIEPQLDSTGVCRLERVRRAAGRLLCLLGLERLASVELEGRQLDAVSHEAVDVSRLVHSVSETMLDRAERRRVRLEVCSMGGEVRGEFALLSEALFNLVANAVEATSPGGTVRVATRRSEAGDHHWTVADEGPGMPLERLRELQAHGICASKSGLGAGLAYAVSAFSRHGGLVRIDSALGIGTNVQVWLPAPSFRLGPDRQ